jgi:hypothetical protein
MDLSIFQSEQNHSTLLGKVSKDVHNGKQCRSEGMDVLADLGLHWWYGLNHWLPPGLEIINEFILVYNWSIIMVY